MTVASAPSAAVVLLGLISPSSLQGATLAGLTAAESTVYIVDGSDLVGPATSGTSAVAGSGIVCMNRFSVISRFSMITDVTIQWGLIQGTSNFTAGIWSDPNQDGLPHDAVLLATSALTPAIAGNYFQQVQFEVPHYIGAEGTSFFVGVYWRESSQAGVDLFMGRERPLLGASPSWSKSWNGLPPDPSDLSGSSVVSSTNRAFVIRPTAVVPEPTSGLLFAMAAVALTLRRGTLQRSLRPRQSPSGMRAFNRSQAG